MKHLGTKYLETERLELRKFVIEDAKDMFNNWASDAKVTKFLTWPAHESMEVSASVLEEWTKAYSQPDYCQWAIILKGNGNDPIGCIGVNTIDERTEMAHIGYCLGRQWWHQGIMSEALKRVIEFLFDEVEVKRIESRFDPNNLHSGAVMEKCGMKYEGTLRMADWNNQGICDASYYTILKDEYSIVYL